jgi:undecaprenyl-diphosphatase
MYSRVRPRIDTDFLQIAGAFLQMLHLLSSYDKKLFLYLNGLHDQVLDGVMYHASDPWCWLPLYCWIAVFLLVRYRKLAFYFYAWLGLLLGVSDQLSSHVMKPWFQRLRPSHEPGLQPLVHLSPAGPGGLYGFVSGHATNTFALAFFLALTLPSNFRPLKCLLFAWAALVAYSRIYNGVHYPGDILGGMLLGAVVAYGCYRLFTYFLGTYILGWKRFFDK